MKTKELRLMSKAELARKLSELREEVRALRFRAHGEGLKNVRALRKARRSTARVVTILKEK